MPRRREVPKRYVLPDPKFNSRLAAKFINNVMRRGKKSTAEQIFYLALTLIEQRSKQDPLDVFHKALENVRPVWRSNPGVWAEQLTRSPWKCARSDATLWP